VTNVAPQPAGEVALPSRVADEGEKCLRRMLRHRPEAWRCFQLVVRPGSPSADSIPWCRIIVPNLHQLLGFPVQQQDATGADLGIGNGFLGKGFCSQVTRYSEVRLRGVKTKIILVKCQEGLRVLARRSLGLGGRHYVASKPGALRKAGMTAFRITSGKPTYGRVTTARVLDRHRLPALARNG